VERFWGYGRNRSTATFPNPELFVRERRGRREIRGGKTKGSTPSMTGRKGKNATKKGRGGRGAGDLFRRPGPRTIKMGKQASQGLAQGISNGLIGTQESKLLRKFLRWRGEFLGSVPHRNPPHPRRGG